VVVEFLDFGVNTLQCGVGVVAFLEENDAFDDVAVIDQLAVHIAIGFPDLAEPNLGALNDFRDVADPQSCSVGGFQDGLLDVVDVGEEADFLDVDLLLTLLDEATAGVDVVGGKLLLDLLDGQAIGDEFFRIDNDLVLARETAEAGYIDDAGNTAEGFFELPVFDALQLHVVDGGVGAFEGVPVDLADRAPVSADLRLQACGEGDLAESLEDFFAIPVVHAVVIEDHGDAGEAGEGGGPQMGHVGDAGHDIFEGDGDLLLDVLG